MMIPGGSHEGNKPVVGVDLQQSREYFAQMLPHSKGQEGDGCSNLDPVRAGFGAAATTALITTSVFTASSRAATAATAGELVRAAWSPLSISAPMIPGYNTEQEIPSIHVPLAGVDAGFSQPPVAEIVLSGEIERDCASHRFSAVRPTGYLRRISIKTTGHAACYCHPSTYTSFTTGDACCSTRIV